MAASFGQSECPTPFLDLADFPYRGGEQDSRLCSPSPLDQNTTCCLPCPFTDWVYPDNFNTVTTGANWVGLGSILCCILLLLTFAVLPVQKTSRHYLTICLIVGVGVLMLSFVIPLGAQPNQCFDSITPNDMRSDLACAFSGSSVLFGGMASIIWVLIRSLSLHLQICWQIVPGKKFFYGSLLAGWGISIITTALSLVLSGVSYRFGSVCHINHDYSLGTFWGPVIGGAGIAAICQFATLGYCIRVYLRSLMDTGGTYGTASSTAASTQLPSVGSMKTVSARAAYRRVRKVVALQWRGVMVVIIVLASAAYFTAIFIKLDSITVATRDNPVTALPWLACLSLNGGNKDQCLDLTKEFVLSQPAVVTVLYLIVIMGFWCVLFLGRWSMVSGWWEFLCGAIKKDDSWISADAHRMSDPGKYEILNAPTQQYYMSKGPEGLVATATVPIEKDQWPLSPLSPIRDSKEVQPGTAFSPLLAHNSSPGMDRTMSSQTTRPAPRKSVSQTNNRVTFDRNRPANLQLAVLSPRSTMSSEYSTPQTYNTPGSAPLRNHDYFSRPFSRPEENLRPTTGRASGNNGHDFVDSPSDRGWFGHESITLQRSNSSLGRSYSNRTPSYDWDYQRTFIRDGSEKRQSRNGALSPSA